ncbi:MAG: hypothetical protein LQ340_000888 [Diploschistes diacapsis]|nr:MAG: hypothetical protein LQ340_000888 [Diploschistes diacapsis]
MLWISFVVAATLKACLAQNVSTYNFLSRPDIKAPVLNECHCSWNLVWFGSLTVENGFQAFDLQACNYQGSPHLCWTNYQGPIYGGPGGSGSDTKILGPSYEIVQSVEPSGQYRGQN